MSMYSEREYEELQTQLRDEIGARHGLPKDAIEIIPLTTPDLMRAHASNLAKLTGAKPVQQGEGSQGKADGDDDKAKTVKAINKRVSGYLDFHYQPPAQRQR